MRTKTLALAGLAAALVWPATARAQQETPAEGAKVYAVTCGRCHNPRSPLERTDRDWVVITAHMRIRGNLTGPETRAVQAFLRSMNGGSEAPATGPQAAAPLQPGPPDASLPARGRALVAQYNCAACHKVADATSGTLGPDLNTVLRRRTAEYILQKLDNPRIDSPNSMMPQLGLSADARRAILEYLRTIQKQ